MRRILTFSLVISALLCFDVFADQVTLKNGDRLSGTIVKSDGETLSLPGLNDQMVFPVLGSCAVTSFGVIRRTCA